MPAGPMTSMLCMAARAIEFHAPASWGSWIAIVAIAIFCLMVSAFVSGSEIAYFGLTRQEIDELKELTAKEATRAMTLLSAFAERIGSGGGGGASDIRHQPDRAIQLGGG